MVGVSRPRRFPSATDTAFTVWAGSSGALIRGDENDHVAATTKNSTAPMIPTAAVEARSGRWRGVRLSMARSPKR